MVLLLAINGKAQAAKELLNSKPDLPNFHQVHPYLYRGGEPSQGGLNKLKQQGIATVIDLRAPSLITRKEKVTAEKLGMKYVNLPMGSLAPSKSQVDTFLALTERARKNHNDSSYKNEDGPVFIHCAHGSDRTGCMVGIWRVVKDGFSYNQAYREMRKYYFGPQYKELSGAVQKYATQHR